MSKKLCMDLVGVIAFAAIAGTANAETLLGKNYIGGSFGIVQFGDDEMDEVLGNAYAIAIVGNINLNPNMDLHVFGGYLWADGDTEGNEIDITSLGAGADLIYFFKPNEKVNPYVGAGLAVIKREVEVSGFGMTEDEEDTEVGFGGEVGVELEFTEQVLFNFSLNYFNIDSEDSISVNAGVGYWFNEQVMGSLSGSYDFDEEDALATLGLIFKL